MVKTKFIHIFFNINIESSDYMYIQEVANSEDLPPTPPKHLTSTSLQL